MFRAVIISLFLTNAVLNVPQATAHADQVAITIDGEFEDWIDVTASVVDNNGDGMGAVDFTRIWLADDDRFLFLRIEATDDFDLSDDNSILLYIDTDANTATGIKVGGIGAELEWRLGNRWGTFNHNGNSTTVYNNSIRFRGAPTVTSNDFEMAVGRDMLPDGSNPLFTGTEIRVLLVDENSGDMIPNAGTLLSYTLDEGSVSTASPIPFEKPSPLNLRVVTHNILNNNLFDKQYQQSFKRLYTAVSPDIFHLQELSNYSASEATDLFTSWFGGDWYGAQVENGNGYDDCKTISRYPIIDSWAIDGNLALLIDTTDSIGTPILCINAHLPCCTNDSGRQDEVDAMIAFIRDAYLPGGVLNLTSEVPVMIAGDLNLVGLSQQLVTLVTGDIQNEFEHGQDSPPDPDGSDLHSITSRQTEKRMGYTWRNDPSNYAGYWPGQLDFLMYSDSNLTLTHDFIVYTPEMSPDELTAHSLLSSDSLASDHLVFCADFAPACAEDVTSDGNIDVSDLLSIIEAWGLCFGCDEDINEDAWVNVSDLLIIIGAWGQCE
jgi:endonuclease/exonuclease/phosphatase family metal-dependent hydrolase